MQLKIAEEKDIPILVELLKEFVENNINVNQTFDEETVTDLLHDLHENKEALVLTNDSLSGILLAIIVPCLFNNSKQSLELAFYIRPKDRSLTNANGFIKAFEYWSKELMKANTATMSLFDKRVEKLYRKKGYSFVESAYLKEL